jgi:acyl-coenzyme A synthetase/AMP-(fatty) acid ligase
VPPSELAATGGRGVRWDGEFATWDELLALGRGLTGLVGPGRAFVVDPSAGIAAMAALFAVASMPDVTLLWAAVDTLGVPHRELAPGLHEVEPPVTEHVGRPLWGVCTSGSSGRPKVAIGHADLWELVALHYQRAMYDDALPGGPPDVLATNLPLQFSAAFFMTVLPSMFLRHDLVVFPAHDWTPVHEAARERNVAVLTVPAMATAACLAASGTADMSRVALFLGGGHVSAERVRLIRTRFAGVSIANLYGTAETGAVALDRAPGHNEHVGHPIPGKAVWLEGADERGIGSVATSGPDCCRYVWRPGEGVTPNDGHVVGTDLGRFDEQGRLCLEGRVDGAEKLMGVLVHPRSIERHLLTLPGVVDARVLVRHGSTGLEHLVARVVGTVDEASVRAHCAALPEIERPSRVECVAEADALTAYSANGKL